MARGLGLVDGDAEALGLGAGVGVDEGAEFDGDEGLLIFLVRHAQFAGKVAAGDVGLAGLAGALRGPGAEEEGVLGDAGAAVDAEGLGGRGTGGAGGGGAR